MILQCPSCDTKYNFPDESYKEGRKVKCTICEHVFPLPPQEAEPEDEPPVQDEADDDFFGDSGDDDIDSLFDDDEDEAPRQQAAGEDDDDLLFDQGVSDPEDAPADRRKDRSSVDDEFSLDDDLGKGGGNFDLDAMAAKDAKKGSGKRSKLAMVMGLVALLVLGGLAYYFVPQFMGDSEPPQEEPAGTEEVITTEQIKNFSLEDVKQYYVDNDKVGKLFVVQARW